MKIKVISIIMVLVILLTACVSNKNKPENNAENDDRQKEVTTNIKETELERFPVCNQENLSERAFCLIENKLYSQVEELLSANDKEKDKVISVLSTYASCMSTSALPDECGKVSESVLYLHDKNILDNNQMLLLITTLENKRIAELEEKQNRSLKEYNDKYFVPEIGMSAEKVLESTWGNHRR
ncbi:hypothetical protein VQ056_26825 [Paenibacillus sp. JTLBN-2024]